MLKKPLALVQDLQDILKNSSNALEDGKERNRGFLCESFSVRIVDPSFFLLCYVDKGRTVAKNLSNLQVQPRTGLTFLQGERFGGFKSLLATWTPEAWAPQSPWRKKLIFVHFLSQGLHYPGVLPVSICRPVIDGSDSVAQDGAVATRRPWMGRQRWIGLLCGRPN